MKKLETINLKGNLYAKVAARIKLFREDTVRGDISTEQIFNPDGTMTFKTTIIADRSDEHSKRSTGHATKKIVGEKDSEKLETISTGRALANLGYLASGDVASFEEMEDFYKFKDDKKQEVIKKLQACKNVDELKKVFLGLGDLMADKDVIEAKDKTKECLKCK